MKTKNTSGASSPATKKAKGGKAKMTPLGKAIVRGFEEATAAERGEIQPVRTRTFYNAAGFVSARGVRLKTGLSQAQFAKRFGFNVRTLQNWEQGREFPEGALKAYLKVIARDQHAVEKALAVA